MKIRLTILLSLLMTSIAFVSGRPEPATTTIAQAQFEMRCGWFSNPTPGNVWLYDRDGEWTIEVQGGYRVEGDWEWRRHQRQADEPQERDFYTCGHDLEDCARHCEPDGE